MEDKLDNDQPLTTKHPELVFRVSENRELKTEGKHYYKRHYHDIHGILLRRSEQYSTFFGKLKPPKRDKSGSAYLHWLEQFRTWEIAEDGEIIKVFPNVLVWIVVELV